VSETAVALGELLDSAEGVIDGPTSYLIGQLAAELVTSSPDAVLSEVIVTTHQDRQAAPISRESLFPMLSGLLQGVLSHRQYAGRAGSPLTVRERVLNLLAIEPRNPKSLSAEIGCSVATASRALSRLRDSELVERTSNSEHSDGRYVMYQLTEAGGRRQDDHFFGLLGDDDPVAGDDYEHDEYDYGHSLAQLTQLVAELSNQDPVIASGLYPTLELLKDQVDDPQLRADALGKLSVLARCKPDLVSAEQSRGWVDELLALAQEGNPLIDARAHYERARWAMRYESMVESSIEDDLATAAESADAAGGPDGADLHAWCLYQQSSWAAMRWEWTRAESLAREASSEFDRLGDHYGRLVSHIVAARAKLALGEGIAADDMFAEVVNSARHLGYKRLIAEGLFWQGQAKIWINDDQAREILLAAAVLYSALGDQDKSAMASASAEMAPFIAGDKTAEAARSLRTELEKTSAEIEEATGISSLERSWTTATINRRIGVLSTVAGDTQRADRAWERAVAEFTASDSPEGIAATLASFWLTNNSGPTASVASDDDIRAVAKRWKLIVPDRTIGLALTEVSRVPSDPVDRFKGFLAYG
jgi:hypothetical protein